MVPEVAVAATARKVVLVVIFLFEARDGAYIITTTDHDPRALN